MKVCSRAHENMNEGSNHRNEIDKILLSVRENLVKVAQKDLNEVPIIEMKSMKYYSWSVKICSRENENVNQGSYHLKIFLSRVGLM
jgi:hypothetical protein